MRLADDEQLSRHVGALLVRAVMAGPRDPAAHVYPIYSNMRLIRLVDFQPIIAAILLFQMARIGKTDVTLYDGSWHAWGQRPDLPRESV